MRGKSWMEIILRVGVFGTFLGHGYFAFQQHPGWVPYLNFVGFSDHTALQLMPVIGIIDFLVALSILVKPLRPIVIYAIIWAFITALMRPLTGESIFMFVERAANWALPLTLYLYLFTKKKP